MADNIRRVRRALTGLVGWGSIVAVTIAIGMPVGAGAARAESFDDLASASTVDSGHGAPPDFREVSRQELADGLSHQEMVGQSDLQRIHVARLAADAPVALRAVLSNEEVGGSAPRLERTTSMCRRVDCLVAVNADFALVGENVPVGGLIVAGELIRSPSPAHHQLNVSADGTLSMGALPWRGRVVSTDLDEMEIDGVNVPRRDDQLVLYTRRHGPTTATNAHGTELVFEVVSPAPPVRLDQTAVLRLVSTRRGEPAAALSERTVVLSGHGAAARRLDALAAGVAEQRAGATVLLRLEADGIIQSVGGTPLLVRDGIRHVADNGQSFIRGRHPRTMVGWTAEGETLLVTVDGRQAGGSRGLSLLDAADLMIELGAVDAINLDGGGSSTFVVAGSVVNRPSDTYVRRGGRTTLVAAPRSTDNVVGSSERAVVSALAVVARPDAVLDAAPPIEPHHVDVPEPEPATTIARAADPASSPIATLPGLVWARPAPLPPPLPSSDQPVALAVVVLAMAAGATGAVARGRPSIQSG
ncbi:MAG TPA: phosphodiester glycosidase family protein [Acidimicrobiales bacterium]